MDKNKIIEAHHLLENLKGTMIQQAGITFKGRTSEDEFDMDDLVDFSINKAHDNDTYYVTMTIIVDRNSYDDDGKEHFKFTLDEISEDAEKAWIEQKKRKDQEAIEAEIRRREFEEKRRRQKEKEDKATFERIRKQYGW